MISEKNVFGLYSYNIHIIFALCLGSVPNTHLELVELSLTTQDNYDSF